MLSLDVTDAAAVEAAIGEIVARHGRIDIVVSNAGITRDQLLLRMKRDDWDAVLHTNLTASFVLCQAALKPMLRQRSGRIVAISSVVGQMGNAGQANYAASKAGLIGFCKSMAREVGSRGITVQRGRARAHRDGHDQGIDGRYARRLGDEDPARPAWHTRGCGACRVLSCLRRGVVYYWTRSGRERRDVHLGGSEWQLRTR